MSYQDSIEDLIESLTSGLSGWLMLHSSAYGTWAWQDLTGAHKYVGEQVSAILLENIKETDPMFLCSNCQDTFYNFDIGDYNKCPNCGRFCSGCDDSYYEDFIDDCIFSKEHGTIEQIEDILDNMCASDYDIIMEIAFEKWCDQEFPGISNLIDEAEAALDELESAQETSNPVELMAALVMALHCCHMGGLIATDYAGLDSDFVDNLQQNGLASVYDESEIDWYFGL